MKRFWLVMADSDNDSKGQNNNNNVNKDFSAQEQDRFFPIANVSRIMKKEKLMECRYPPKVLLELEEDSQVKR